jgi:hypothetical protein
MKTDGRKNNGGNRNSGRKKGVGVANDIKRHCESFINELLTNEAIRLKAIKQVSDNLEEKNNFFYIIKNENKYKLGFTSNIKKRYKNYKAHLGSVNLVYVYEGVDSNVVEKYFHEKFNCSRVVGEYFKLTDLEVMSIISYCSSLKVL